MHYYIIHTFTESKERKKKSLNKNKTNKTIYILNFNSKNCFIGKLLKVSYSITYIQRKKNNRKIVENPFSQDKKLLD